MLVKFIPESVPRECADDAVTDKKFAGRATERLGPAASRIKLSGQNLGAFGPVKRCPRKPRERIVAKPPLCSRSRAGERHCKLPIFPLIRDLRGSNLASRSQPGA
jgi:hypothetical protein